MRTPQDGWVPVLSMSLVTGLSVFVAQQLRDELGWGLAVSCLVSAVIAALLTLLGQHVHCRTRRE